MRISDWSSDVCSSDLTVPVVTPAHIAGNGSRHINHSRAHACSRYVFKDEVLDEQYLVWLQRVILIRSGRLSLLILAVDQGVGPPLRPFNVPKDAVHHTRIEIGFWMMCAKVVVGPYLCLPFSAFGFIAVLFEIGRAHFFNPCTNA